MEIQKLNPQILDQFRKKVVQQDELFLQIHNSFFTQYQEDIIELKKKVVSGQLSSNLPSEIWTFINTHFDQVHDQIVSGEEKQKQALYQTFWEELKQESNAILNEVPEKIQTSFVLEKFFPDQKDKFGRKQLKKFSHRYYRIKDTLFSLIRRKKNFLESGRRIDARNYYQYYYLLPAAQILFDRWNENARLNVQTLASLQKTTKRFKDTILAIESLTEKDIYWRKVINPEIGKIVSDYENSVKEAAESNKMVYQAMAEEFNVLVDAISIKAEETWNIAGTGLLANRKFDQHKINSQWDSITKKHRRMATLWENHLKKLRDEWLKDIDLTQVQLTTAHYWYETVHIIKNKFYKDIVPLFKEILKKIKETRDSIQINEKTDLEKSELKNKILLLNRKLVQGIREKDLPDLLSLLDPEAFSQSFSGFIKRLNIDIEKLPEEHTVLAFLDMENLPSKIKSDTVALKDLLQAETFYTAERKIDAINLNLRQELDAASRSFSRLDQVIEYNIEGALNIIRNEDNFQAWQEAVEIAQKGLERVEQNIEDLINTIQTQIENSLKKFDLLSADLEESIQILGDNEELLKLKIRLTRARTKANFIEIRKKIWEYIRHFLPKLIHLVGESVKKIRERYSKVQRLAGLGTLDVQSEISFTQYLSDVEEKINQMPYIYQRIFRTEPLVDDKFFVGRTKVLATITQDFEDFKKNYHPITALVGEKGSGKTSALNYARRNIFKGYPFNEIEFERTVHTREVFIENLKSALGLPDVQSIQDVIYSINNQKENRICLIENVHNLFIRTIEGFQALEDLFLLISKTRQNIFWIISCGRYAWDYLETVTKISSFFKRIIYLEDLSTEEIKNMILDRHQISGYGINFIPPEKIIQSRQYKKLATPLQQQQYLEKHFFNRLSDSAEGNMRVAIYFWLSAITEFKESSIDIEVDIKFESKFLYQLPTDEILSLAAFIQHEYLNEEQYAIIFNQSLNDSSILIEKLYKKGILIRNENDFIIHPYLFRPIVRSLKLRNII